MRDLIQSTSLRGHAVPFLGAAALCLSIICSPLSAFAETGTEADREFSAASGEVLDMALDLASDDDVSGAIAKLETLAKQENLSAFERSAVLQMVGAYHYELGQLFEAKSAFDDAFKAGGMSQSEIDGLEPVLANLNALEKLGLLKPKAVPNLAVKKTKPVIVKSEPVPDAVEPALLMASSESKPVVQESAPNPIVPENETPDLEIIADQDARPLVRIPPMAPARFLQGENSGYCDVRFNVTAEGQPSDVDAVRCTDDSLHEVSIVTVQKWKYHPKIVNGRAVVRNGVESKVSYILTDERGKKLPLPQGF